MPGKPVSWSWFHSPDFSMPVVRRRVSEDLVDLVCELGGAMATRGRSLWSSPVRDEASAYYTALSRLRRDGVLVTPPRRGLGLKIQVSEGHRPDDILRPEGLWGQKWGGVWSLLIYDIAEADRGMRDQFRRYLKRLRMGCLQKSVWVSPRDIRPEYDDWAQGLHLDIQSYLFESRTVLGRGSADVVARAWDWKSILRAHAWYIGACTAAVRRLESGGPGGDDLATVAREELTAYRTALDEDPLLPAAIWPAGYTGRKVAALHRRFTRALRRHL